MSGGSVNLNTLSLTHVIPSQGAAWSSVAVLADQVFVACNRFQVVKVYDARTFISQRSLTVPGFGQYCNGLAACVGNNCLYASDWQNNSIHRVDLSGSNAVMKWSVASQPAGLSVNKAHNIVVACYGANKLQEYTTRGTLVREISLQQAGATNPWQAVQLSTGDYVFSCGSTHGVVGVVGVDGQVVCSYDQSHSSDVGPTNHPRSLAVTKNDDILVADYCNNRILSMNSALSSVHALALPVDGGIKQPFGLCLDESRGQLYISEYGRCRVLVFCNC